MSMLRALASGAVGAVVLNVVHETTRRFLPEAPRVHRVGMRAIAAPIRRLGRTPPDSETLYGWTLAGDLVGNSLYYSLVGLGRPEHALVRGAALGLAGGLGVVALPGPLGLGSRPVARTPATRLMTVTWYALGGLTAAATYAALEDSL